MKSRFELYICVCVSFRHLYISSHFFTIRNFQNAHCDLTVSSVRRCFKNGHIYVSGVFLKTNTQTNTHTGVVNWWALRGNHHCLTCDTEHFPLLAAGCEPYSSNSSKKTQSAFSSQSPLTGNSPFTQSVCTITKRIYTVVVFLSGRAIIITTQKAAIAIDHAPR